MTTRTEVHMTVQDVDGHAIILNQLIKPENVAGRVDYVMAQHGGDLTITLSVNRYEQEKFRRIMRPVHNPELRLGETA